MPFMNCCRSLMLIILFIGTLVTTGCETSVPVPPIPQRISGLETIKLEQLTQRYLELLWRLHPSIAAVAGEPPTVYKSLACTHEQILASMKEAGNLLEEAYSLRKKGLGERELKDRKLLIDHLGSTLFEITAISPWTRDPGVYLDEIQGGLALARRAQNDTARGEQTRLWLLDVPRILQAAKDNQRFSPPIFVSSAGKRVKIFAAQLREGEILPQVRDQELQSEIKSAAQLAAQAMLSWASMLETHFAHKQPGSYILGAHALNTVLQKKEGILTPPATLVQLLKDQEKQLAKALAKAAKDESIPTALHRASIPAQDASLFLNRVGQPEARQFCLTHNLLPKKLMSQKGPREKEVLSLAQAKISREMGRPVEASWKPSSNGQWSLFLARYTWPGQLALPVGLAQASSQLQRGVSCQVIRQGWLSYAEDLWCEKNKDPRVLLHRAWHRLQECLESRLALQLHLGQTTLHDATLILENRAFLPPSQARVRAQDLARNPIRHLGYLACLSIHQLRQTCKRREGKTFQLARFHDQILTHSGLPLFALRQEILGEKIQKPDNDKEK